MNQLPFKRTKIVCTIGPATSSLDALQSLIDAGLDVARLNFSHGSHADHAQVIKNIRQLSPNADRPIAILQDLQGPKIRVSTLETPIILEEGATISLGPDGSNTTLPLQFDFTPYVEIGHPIFIDDGNIELQVTARHKDHIEAKVVAGGPVKSHKGINIPETVIPSAALTDKDREDAVWGVSQRVDYIALSFVQNAEDIRELRQIIRHHHGTAKIIAKIERKEAVKNIREIAEAADGLMVARGDLAMEAGLEEVPIIQRDLITLGRQQKKPVIVATQMLESMVTNHAPTRAEVNDVASAVMTQADAVMLSAETAVGHYPNVTVRTMRRIITRIEQHRRPILPADLPNPTLEQVSPDSRNTDAVALAATILADQLEAALLVIGTSSGYTAQAVSADRPDTPLIAVTHEEHVYQQLALIWGVQAFLVPKTATIDDFFAAAIHQILRHHYAQSGDKIVIASGGQPGLVGGTNILKIHTV